MTLIDCKTVREMDVFDQPEQEIPNAVNVTPAEQEAIQRVHTYIPHYNYHKYQFSPVF